MKTAVAILVTCGILIAQTKTGNTQTARDCVVNIQGNSDTGSVTCLGVDKKLADQIGQLVAASKRDGKTLKEISDKVGEVLKALDASTPSTSVLSINQQGGITAAQVNINGTNAVTISFSQVSANQPTETADGTVFVSFFA